MSKPSLGPLERRYLLDAFDSGWVSSLGEYVDRSEETLRAVAGTQYAAVASNGTTALHLVLVALQIGPGDEVIIPASTYVATLNAVLYVGARPVVVDVESDTWCILPAAVEDAITPRTRAVIGVDLYGHPADYDALRAIGRRHGITVIADAAESIGGSWAGAPVGSLADISTFSFFGNKVITSGEGGAVTTDNRELDSRVRQLRNQGNHPEIRYFHEVLGYNYRMTNLSAALLTAQLERIDELTTRRRGVISLYRRLLAESSDIFPQGRSGRANPSPWMFSVELGEASESVRADVMRRMLAEGIETRPVFRPVQDMPYFDPLGGFETPVAARIARRGISLPTYPELEPVDIERVVDTLVMTLRAARGV